MRIQLNSLLLFVIFTCSLTLALSIYPGVLNSLVVFLAIAFLWLMLMGWFAIATLLLWCKRDEAAIESACRQLIATFFILVASYGLLKFYIPRRIAFSLSRPAFERWLATHPDRTAEVQTIDTKLGIYKVDRYFSGWDGDSYFRVYSHGDGLGPDTVSYGFAYQPNQERSPFGAANYKFYSLGHGWYWFRASNDW